MVDSGEPMACEISAPNDCDNTVVATLSENELSVTLTELTHVVTGVSVTGHGGRKQAAKHTH